MNESIYDEGVYGTATATPGLFIIQGGSHMYTIFLARPNYPKWESYVLYLSCQSTKLFDMYGQQQ